MAIFVPNPPIDLTTTRRQCPECKNHVEEWADSCDSCGKRFHMCVATGRSILDERYITCQTCRHPLLEDAQRHFRCVVCAFCLIEDAGFRLENCPLCHHALMP